MGSTYRMSGEADASYQHACRTQDRLFHRMWLPGLFGGACFCLAFIPGISPLVSVPALIIMLAALGYATTITLYLLFLSGRRFWILHTDKRDYKKWLASGSPTEHAGHHHAIEGRHHTDPDK